MSDKTPLRIDINLSKSLVSFFSKIRVGENNCWEWQGATQECGYGIVQYKNKMFKAHRFSYQIHNGDMDPKLVLDHTCMNRKCVNPKHLRLVTKAQNTLENSRSASALNKMKTVCRNGHPFDGFYVVKGQLKRRCQVCYKANMARNRSKYYQNKLAKLKERK